MRRTKRTGTHHGKRRLLAVTGALLAASVWTAPAASAAEDKSLEFDIALNGTQVEGSDYYGGSVAVQVDLPRDDESLSLWINDAGVWKLISPAEGNHKTYTLSFSENGNYDLTFRVESSSTLDSFTKDVSFSINSLLSDAVKRIEALPGDDAEEREILGKKAEIVAVQNLVNGLREDVRDELSEAELAKVEDVRKRLSELEPDADYEPPAAPSVDVSGETEEIGGFDYAAGPLELSVRASGTDRVLINTGSGWSDLAQDDGGAYKHTLSEPGQYHIDFCLEDSSGNRGESVSYDFVVDPDIPTLVSEVDRLYKNAQTLSQDEYITTLETLYLQYLDFSPLRQSLVPDLTAGRVEYMYDTILDALRFQTEVQADSAHFIRAVGMYEALNIPALYMGSSDVVFHAQRAEAPSAPEGITGEVLAEYQFSFSCEDMEEDNLPVDEAHPVRICIQVPEDLKGRKNVDMLYVGGGGDPVSMGVKVRSTEENLVLYFDLKQPGRYLFVADPLA